MRPRNFKFFIDHFIGHEKKSGYPKYLVRGIATSRAFTEFNRKKGKFKGLLILFETKKDLKRISRKVEGNLRKEFVKKYGNPILYSNNVFELYDKMSSRDGALVFDTWGNLIASEVYIEKPCTKPIRNSLHEIIELKGRLGARHIAGAYASTKGLDAIAVSEEKGTVIPFRKGKILKDLSYIPEK